MKRLSLLLLCAVLILLSCKSYVAKTHIFPVPIDTHSKPITRQVKKIYTIEEQGVCADNLFDGARLNGFKYKGNNLYEASIAPENFPINASPYYAFRLWADPSQDIQVQLHYTKHRHRYSPKVSIDGQHWVLLDTSHISYTADSTDVILDLRVGYDTLWVAAQPIQNARDVLRWCSAKAQHKDVYLYSIGKSTLDRNLWCLDIHGGKKVKKKKIITVLCRQHPPEVTGYFAMQAFVEALLADNPLANDFRKKYRILVIPLMNPDGVDMGHWRHNAGGVDLNRDWSFYHQVENRVVADFLTKTVRKNNSEMILGLDFHSTYWDVYYTNRAIPKYVPRFKDYWLWSISQHLREKVNEKSSNAGKPTSKNWFHAHFDAMGITYEIGDNTPPDFIREKGRVSGIELMKLLVLGEK